MPKFNKEIFSFCGSGVMTALPYLSGVPEILAPYLFYGGLIGMVLTVVHYLFPNFSNKKLFTKSKIEVSNDKKKIVVRSDGVLLEVRLLARVELGSNVAHSILISVSNTFKKTMKDIRFIINAPLLSDTETVFPNNIVTQQSFHPNEELNVNSEFIEMNKTSGNMLISLKQHDLGNSFIFDCSFSAENISLKRIVFTIQGEKDIYGNMEMTLQKRF